MPEALQMSSHKRSDLHWKTKAYAFHLFEVLVIFPVTGNPRIGHTPVPEILLGRVISAVNQKIGLFAGNPPTLEFRVPSTRTIVI